MFWLAGERDFNSEWQKGPNRSSLHRSGVNLDLASEQSQSFLHAANADTSIWRGAVRVKTFSMIEDFQAEVVVYQFQSNLSAIGAAVSFDVPESLLHDPKETQS